MSKAKPQQAKAAELAPATFALEIPCAALRAALLAVADAHAARGFQPIFAHVLLTLDADMHLTVLGSDLEIELTAYTQATAGTPGAITVDARKLRDILRSLPDDTLIKAKVEDEKFVLKAGRSRFLLATLPAADFPEFVGDHYDTPMGLPVAALARLLDKTLFCMADGDTRYYLNGLLLECEGGQLRAVASDGHRLAVAEAKVEGRDLQASIVARKGALALGKLLRGASGDAVLARAPNAVECEVAGVRLRIKLIEGRFPDFNRVMPKALATHIRIPAAGFRAALERASLVSDKHRSCALTAKRGELKIEATNEAAETAEEVLAISMDGPDVRTGFSAAYLLETLAHIDGDTATLAFNEAASTSLMTGNKDDCRFIVMPMRL